MLEIKDINVYYSNIHALKNVSLNIKEGEIVTLIGSNGAGKSTTLNSIIGTKKIRSGEIVYRGENIANKSPHEIVQRGIGLVPEGRLVFPDLSVEENLRIGAYLQKGSRGIQKNYKKVYDLFPRLLERKRQAAGTLSGGEQQMLAIGRAMMNNPKLIMLDEPSLGLAPNLMVMIFQMIKEIRDSGITVLLIEQNANMALHIADRGYVLETGRVVLSNSASKLAQDDEVRKAYLGGR